MIKDKKEKFFHNSTGIRKTAFMSLSRGTNNKHTAFTLAEVLITLGIIGVVAALTLPTLIQHHRKSVVETKLAKFYSVMNQAIMRSEVDNGPKELWEELPAGYIKEDDGTRIDQSEDVKAWYKKYLEPYLDSNVKTKSNPVVGNLMIYFPDGSLCLWHGRGIHYWIEAKNFKEYTLDESGTVKNAMEDSGIKMFTFLFQPYNKNNKYLYKKGLEPYITPSWQGNIESLLTNQIIGCKQTVSNERAFCTKLIQMNGWKIPDDYPLKF